MDPYKNPFSPGAGSPPPELAGRDLLQDKAKIALHCLASGRSAKSMILVGLRGVGKTVLLNRLQQHAEAEGFRAIFIEAHESKPLPALLALTSGRYCSRSIGKRGSARRSSGA